MSLNSTDNKTKKYVNYLKHIMSHILQTNIKDPRIGFLTLTYVRIRKDFGHVLFYYTVLGNDKNILSTNIALRSAKGFIRKMFAKYLKVKNVPTLEFLFDNFSKQIENVNYLINKSKK